MEVQTVVAFVGAFVGFLGVAWAVIQHFSARRYQEFVRRTKKEEAALNEKIHSLYKRGETLIESNADKVEQYQKYNTQKFKALEIHKDEVDKRLSRVESQQMTEHKVDTKLKPIKDEVDEVKDELLRVRDEVKADISDLKHDFRGHASLTDMNMQQVLAKLGEVNGYLRAKAEENE